MVAPGTLPGSHPEGGSGEAASSQAGVAGAGGDLHDGGAAAGTLMGAAEEAEEDPRAPLLPPPATTGGSAEAGAVPHAGGAKTVSFALGEIYASEEKSPLMGAPGGPSSSS